jgi:RNA-directed DNA polymerase
MMHGHEKSDFVIVAVKPANKTAEAAAERSAVESTVAEPVEPRAETKGNADQQSTRRAQSRVSVSQALKRIRKVFAVTHPRWEPYAGKPHIRIWAGGAR